jgi:hypothetical protein
MWADTKKARQARDQIVEVFVAWRRGEFDKLHVMRYGSQAMPTAPDAFATSAARSGHVADHIQHLDQMHDLAIRATHLPIWSNGRRPIWWHDIEVRNFITTTHRQMALYQVQSEAERLFGNRAPKKSSIHRYWMRLDTVVGLIALEKVTS